MTAPITGLLFHDTAFQGGLGIRTFRSTAGFNSLFPHHAERPAFSVPKIQPALTTGSHPGNQERLYCLFILLFSSNFLITVAAKGC